MVQKSNKEHKPVHCFIVYLGGITIQQTYFLPTKEERERGDARFCVKAIDRFPGAAAAECNFLAGLIRPPGR